jgi:hypothetical protein
MPTAGGVAGEVAFLRGEVHNLEHVIDAARRVYEEEAAKQAVVLEHAGQQLAASRELNSKLQDEVASLYEQIRVLHAQQVDTRAAIGMQTEEALALKHGVRLLQGELAREEQERHVARELEACALSVASTYRDFARHGAAQMESMESGLQAAGDRLQARLARLGASTTAALRQRALRVVLAALRSTQSGAALRRWAASVALARAAEAELVRITSAVRRETRRKSARRDEALERAVATEALGQARAQIRSLQREIARMEAAAVVIGGEQRPAVAADRAAASSKAPAVSTLGLGRCNCTLEAYLEGTGAGIPAGFVAQAELDTVRADRDAVRTQLSEARAQLCCAEAARLEAERDKHFYEAALRDERRVSAEREERVYSCDRRAQALAQGDARASADLDSLLQAVTELRLYVVDTLLRSVRDNGGMQPLLR